MGQLHGKAAYLRATTPFVNGGSRYATPSFSAAVVVVVFERVCLILCVYSASEKDVNKLWETFNDVAEGFGLNQDEACEICRALQPALEIHAKAEMDQLTTALFTALDTDEVRR